MLLHVLYSVASKLVLSGTMNSNHANTDVLDVVIIRCCTTACMSTHNMRAVDIGFVVRRHTT
jgi:hypothetical protein